MTDLGFDAILELAAITLPAAGVNCLLIGGFAVNHYGYTRNTLDIDFMIAADQVDRIRAIMQATGFTNVSVLDNVVFFGKPGSTLRVDFLRVEPETLRKLDAHAVTATLNGHTLRLPALRDLLAMKLFALAQAPEQRIDKDLPDVAYLSVLNNLDLEADIHPLCQRYGSEALYQQVKEKVGSLRT
jgi:hypothetical protein